MIGALRTAISSKELLLATFAIGSPPVHILNVRLVGHLLVQDGELTLSDCIVEANPSGMETISSPTVVRALSINGGRVTLVRTVLHGHIAGAISVHLAILTLSECSIRNSRAHVGGALLVGDGAVVKLVATNLTGNSAVESGGALQVDGGEVQLLDRTLLEQNTAPDGQGSSIYLASSGSLQYTLPAPPARYLFIRQGDTFELNTGAEDAAFPYLCPAGVIGGMSPEEQSGPACARQW
eukprot:4784607-Prymnesium_polylepis.1